MKYSWTILFCLVLCGCEEIKQRQIEKERSTISVSFYLTTVLHDEHLFILSTHGNFMHHPDCHCIKNKTTEKQETTNILPPIIIDGTKSVLIRP
jgi:hypothetical protein